MNQKLHKSLQIFIVLALILAPMRSILASTITLDLNVKTDMVHMQHEMSASSDMHDCNKCCETDCCEQNCSACVFSSSAILGTDSITVSLLKDTLSIMNHFGLSEHTASLLLRPPIS